MSPRDTQPHKPATVDRPKSGRAVRVQGGEVREIPHPKKAAFLAAIAECGVITRAAAIAGCDRSSHLHWLEVDPDYPAAFHAAMEAATDKLELEARRRAFEGVEEPVFYQGEVCGAVRKYSDTLMMFVLNGYRSDKFRQRHEHTGANGAPISFVFALDNPNGATVDDGSEG